MTTDPFGAAEVQDKRTVPSGVLPKNLQSRVLGGLAILMIIIIAISSRRPPEKAAAPTPQAALESDQAKIDEYRARIDEQAKKLQAEQARLARDRAAELPVAAPAASYPAGSAATYYRYPEPQGAPQKNWIEEDKEKREYQSLFASNIALSRRDTAKPARQAAPDTPVSSAEDSTGLATDTGARGRGAHPRSSTPPELSEAMGKTYRLFEGTLIETVLTNRLDGTFSGPVKCMVSSDLYSHDGRYLLVPRGSLVLGEVKPVDSVGQQRLAVLFHRIIMPDSYSVDLDQFKGLSQVGETGLKDQINHHYMQMFGVSIAIGAIAGLAQANTHYGVDVSAADAYQQGVATSLAQSSMHILDRFLNVLPTFTIREGQRVQIYLSQDLLLPAYENHRIVPDP